MVWKVIKDRGTIRVGDTLARWGAWHRKYKVLAVTKTEDGWAVTIEFIGSYFADGKIVAPTGRNTRRDVMVLGETGGCPVPPSYAIVMEET